MEIGDAIYSMISKLGFPIFVATFLLLRVDRTLRDILALLSELVIAVKVLAQLADEDEGEEAVEVEAEDDLETGGEDPPEESQ